MKARLAALLLACFASTGAAELSGLPSVEIRLVTATGTHPLSVWIAADDRSRERGLMYVRELPPGRGMLFLFDQPQFAAFWMKNTYLSLDLVFIAEDGRVVNVARAATPHSLEPIPSSAPVTGVLELIAGSADRLGVAPGDRVEHPAFAAPAAR